MNMKLFAALECGTALALSACSGGAPANSTRLAANHPAADPLEDTRIPAEKVDDAQTAAKNRLDDARKTARTEIDRARMALDEAVKANSAAFTSTTFKDVMYADGEEIFSLADDDGDEFKVDGWVGRKDFDSNRHP